ncbi:MCE family protein [Tomitella biformata]|uniref:MCE family protein n=1 Tax=Tomitella biformata TaxID=630403 RepID=UPI0004AEB1B0|nr:MCE family protein [Tomitella biformata]
MRAPSGRGLRQRVSADSLKMCVYTVVMVLILAFLVLVFGQFRTGASTQYNAVFTSSSGMASGAPVRIAGVQVGKVGGLDLQPDNTVAVRFSVDNTAALPPTARAAIRYENLVGDRYLEILPPTPEVDGAAGQDLAGQNLKPGGTIPVSNTEPALDLDLLLGGFKPLFRALDPGQVNKLTAALLDTFQGQGDTLASLLGRTGRFTSALADSDAMIGEVIGNLNTVLSTISDRGEQFSGTVDQLQQLVSGLAADRDPLGQSVTHINQAAGAISGLLVNLRPPLQDTVEQLRRTTALLDEDKDNVNDLLTRLPDTYKRLSRTGSYGSFFQFYMCGLVFRFTDPQGEMFEYPMVQQTEGRCAPR